LRSAPSAIRIPISRDVERERTIDTDTGQQYSQATEDSEENGAKPALAYGVVENVLHPQHVVNREAFIDRPNLLLDGHSERVRIDAGAYRQSQVRKVQHGARDLRARLVLE
jgi:hypothetical protein